MAIWPGEKLGLSDGSVESGTVDWRALDPSDPTLTNVTAGDRFYLYPNQPSLLLPTDTIGDCAWFLEVAAGTVTVTVETGYDVGWTYAGPFTWTPTGVTELAAGPAASVPLPVEDRSYARLGRDGSPLLRVTVTAGTADLASVWLQIEPPGGLKVPTGYVLSDWVLPPVKAVPAKTTARQFGFQQPGGGPLHSATGTYRGDFNREALNHYVGDLSLDPDFLALLNSVLGQMYGTPYDSGWGTPGYYPNAMRATASWDNARVTAFNERDDGGLAFDYDAQLNGIIFQEVKALWEDVTTVRSTDGLGVEGRDYVRAADGTTVEYAGASTSVGWQPGHILPSGANTENHTNRLRGLDINTEHPSPHGETYRLTGTFGQVVAGGQLPANPTPYSSTWVQAQTSGATLVTPTPGEDILLSARHDLKTFKQPATAPWGTTDDRENDWVDAATAGVTWYWTHLEDGYFHLDAPKLLVQPPAFRYLVPVYDTRKPRFYVTYTEVEDRPHDVSHVVGIGKPADDLSIFRVPTPLGTLRELRHGERVADVSVAYPLKVKLEDGSWTIVAGMTPDD